MRFLLTAFEPFDGAGLNSSLEGCRAFISRWGAEFDLEFALLPVRYDADTEIVNDLLLRRPVDVLLHTGQARMADAVKVERIAVNARYGDEELRRCPEPGREREVLIDPAGPPAYFSTLPAEEAAEAIRSAGVPARVSSHAGVYLCNHVFYRSLQRADRSGSAGVVGFLHVPRLPEQVSEEQPSMSAQHIAAAIHAVVRRLASPAG